jgi:YidC/Oxa1 family membrane protein insertase
MLMAQETQKLYAENDIHPFGSMMVMFIQLPVMMGMFYATMRAVTTVYGTFMGMSLAETPLTGIKALQWSAITVYVLMIVMSLIQMQIPKWMKAWENKKRNIKVKEASKKNSMTSTMNMTMYMTTALIAFMYINWPMAMSFYWLVSSVIRAGLSVVSHIISVKEDDKKALAKSANSGVLKNRRK